jgi:uncharacterized protein YecE (DUF72 family)
MGKSGSWIYSILPVDVNMENRTKASGWFTVTSGWSYRHWSGIFYPPEIKPARYLEFYISKFDCVELNSSFYHLPRATTVDGWLKRTPDTFRFCVKLSRFITHQKKLGDCEEALVRFFDLFGNMQSRLGPVLIQLPPGLSFDKSLAADFISLLKAQYGSYRFAVEVRHRSWITDGFFTLLAENGIAFVIADSGKRFPYHEAVTADFVYMRFHGMEKLYASDYDESSLLHYAEKILSWLGAGLDVWAFFNNDFNGFAVRNALRLNEMVRTNR